MLMGSVQVEWGGGGVTKWEDEFKVNGGDVEILLSKI